jgi:hypothetical protein
VESLETVLRFDLVVEETAHRVITGQRHGLDGMSRGNTHEKCISYQAGGSLAVVAALDGMVGLDGSKSSLVRGRLRGRNVWLSAQEILASVRI